MTTLPHTPTSEQFRRHVADLYGERDPLPTAAPTLTWAQAVEQVSAALCTKLRLETPPERIRKALDLVLAHAVTLHDDGSASVQGSKDAYTLAPHCPCPDAKQRTELCKHTMAVELHRRALKLVSATAPPTAPAPPASALEAPPSTPPPASVSGTAAWHVQEAPTSACFKWRVGDAELMYTFRGVTDDEVLTRIREQLPLLQDIVTACTASATARTAARQAAQPPAPPAQATPRQQARPQAPEPPRQGHANGPRQGRAAPNGHANDHRNGQRQRPRPTGDQDIGWCSLHNVEMKRQVNERGTWFSHPRHEGGYCKGAR